MTKPFRWLSPVLNCCQEHHIKRFITHVRKPCPAQLMPAVMLLSFLLPYLHMTVLTGFRQFNATSERSQLQLVTTSMPPQVLWRLDMLLKVSL